MAECYSPSIDPKPNHPLLPLDLRLEMVDWLYHIMCESKMSIEVMQLSIVLFDKYQSLTRIPTFEAKLTGIVCLYLADAYTRCQDLMVDDFIQLSKDNMFDKGDFLDKANEILCILNFKLCLDTPYDQLVTYMMKYTKKTALLEDESDALTFYLLSMLVMSGYYLYLDPNNIAITIYKFCHLFSNAKYSDLKINIEINTNMFYIFIYLFWKRIRDFKCPHLITGFGIKELFEIAKKAPPNLKCDFQFDYIVNCLMKISKDKFDVIPIGPLTYTINKTQISAIHHKLGSGTYSDVYKVTLASGSNLVCAAKKFKKDHLEDGIASSVLRELSLFNVISHPNIVNVYGLIYNTNKLKMYMLLELMEDNLTNYMVNYEVKYDLRVSIIKDILNGLEYLHRLHICHRDLYSSNILIKNGVAKIADFGLARKLNVDLDSGECYTNEICSIYFRPIEILLGQTHYGCEIDMWSCGCIIYYILYSDYLFCGTTPEVMIEQIFGTIGLPDPFLHTELYNLDVDVPENSNKIKPKGFGTLQSLYPREAKLIFQMISYDTANRMSARDALMEYDR